MLQFDTILKTCIYLFEINKEASTSLATIIYGKNG